MASLYKRKQSPYYWISYKDSEGKWRNKNTEYRIDNPGDRRNAHLAAEEQTLIEKRSRVEQKQTGSEWEGWVLQWVEFKWGHKTTNTPKQYRKHVFKWLRFFKKFGIPGPAQFKREHLADYMTWRKEVGRNTIIQEIKFMKMVLNEAEARGYIIKNPIRSERMEGAKPKAKSVWTRAEIDTVRAALGTPDNKFGWLHVSFMLGYYQASRIGQSVLPISCIDLERKIIHWPDQLVKGSKGFDQAIDPRFLPILKELIAHRQQLGKGTLCDMTSFCSLGWRRFLDSLGFRHLSHHGLRSVWVTRAALAGIPESAAKKFVNHTSSVVHQIYTRITAMDLAPMLEKLSLS